MTRKVSPAAALVTLLLTLSAFANRTGASQAAADPSKATPMPVAQGNESSSSTKSINAYVRLFEKGDTAGDVVCTLPITSAPFVENINLKKDSYDCSNDEAVSISFSNIPAGSIISLYDDPNCKQGDDWVKFTFFSEVSWTFAHDFEINQEVKKDGHLVFTQAYHDKGNLNGRVSCIIINVPEPH